MSVELPLPAATVLAQAVGSLETPEAEAPFAALDLLLRRLPVVVFRIDPEGRIAEASGRARDAVTAVRGDSRGLRLADAYRDVPAILDAYERARRGETVEIDAELAGRRYRAAYTPLHDGSVLGVAVPAGAEEPAADAVRVAVAEPSPRQRAGLVADLDAERALRVVAAPDDPDAVLAALGARQADVLVVAAALGEAFVRRAAVADPAVRVLVLVAALRPGRVAAWFGAGARGVLPATATQRELAEAVGALHRFGAFLCEVEAPELDGPLSAAERRAVTLLADGLSRDAIAGRLGIAPDSVSSLLSKARKRLGIGTLVGLARHAYRQGWASPHDEPPP